MEGTWVGPVRWRAHATASREPERQRGGKTRDGPDDTAGGGGGGEGGG